MKRIFLTAQEGRQIVDYINNSIQDDEEVLSMSTRYLIGLLMQMIRSGAPLCLDQSEFSMLRSIVNDSSLENIKDIFSVH